MGTLDVYYLYDHGDKPITLSTDDEVDDLIDRVRRESPADAPVLMDVHLSGDPYTQGLDVGIAGDRGVIRYSGRDWPRGVVSVGEGLPVSEPRSYYYMGHERDFPANAEVPLTAVRAAIKEFMESNGERPNSVQWRPGP